MGTLAPTMPGMTRSGPDFPVQRPRRLRSTAAMRELVAETNLAVSDLIAPLFVREGIAEQVEITSLPGVPRRMSSPLVPTIVAELRWQKNVGAACAGAGVRAMAIAATGTSLAILLTLLLRFWG